MHYTLLAKLRVTAGYCREWVLFSKSDEAEMLF